MKPIVTFTATLLILLLFVLDSHRADGIRMLHYGNEDGDGHRMVLQSLQRGTVPPSGPSGCTEIPGSTGPPCLVQEKLFSGQSLPGRRTHPGGLTASPSFSVWPPQHLENELIL
ncbi:hypothetical protein QQ045_010114 [Rhodiola kirilowii]